MRVNPHTMTPRHPQTSQFQPSIRHRASESSHDAAPSQPTGQSCLCNRPWCDSAVIRQADTDTTKPQTCPPCNTAVTPQPDTQRRQPQQWQNLAAMRPGHRTPARYPTQPNQNPNQSTHHATTQSHGGWVSSMTAHRHVYAAAQRKRHTAATLTIPAQPAPCARRRTRR